MSADRKLLYLCLPLFICLCLSRALAAPLTLEQTFYYDGNMNDPAVGWGNSGMIDVDADGAVALAINRSVGPFNSRVNIPLVLVYDKNGDPIGQIIRQTTIMQGVKFGPDGRVYTIETWFGAGTHIFDRPGAKPRYVPERYFNADGAHVDRGSPKAFGIGPDYKLYTIASQDHKLYVTSPDNKRLQVFDPPRIARLTVATDGTVYAGNQLLQADGTWKDFKYNVRDASPVGKLLVDLPAGKWGIYNPQTDKLEAEGSYPPGNWGNIALGPDDLLYLTPRSATDLGYVVANTKGEIVLQRGADFDRLKVTLPDTTFAPGQSVNIPTQLIRSRDLGWVPTVSQLPADNRPRLSLHADIAPVINDPLGKPDWQALPLLQEEEGAPTLRFPDGLCGQYLLRLAATPTTTPGLAPLAVQTEITLRPEKLRAYLLPKTDRGRTGFQAGQPIRVIVPVQPTADIDLSNAKLALLLDGKIVWQAPLGLGAVTVGNPRTAVVTIPATVTTRLRPALYAAAITGLPADTAGGNAVVAIVSPVRISLFQTPYHPIGSGYRNPVRDAMLHAEIGATHVVNPGEWHPAYLDVATRLGFTFHFQPYTHYSPLNTLPQELGATRQAIAQLAQQMLPYPAFRGFLYHDLQVQPWGGWGDVARKPFYDSLWKDWAKSFTVPPTVPEKLKEQYAYNQAIESMPLRLYAGLGEAIRQVDPGLDRTTMQWWHQPQYIASPDGVSAFQNLITTQHMEEQYFHAVTVANQVDFWRRPGKPVWVFGNTSWQEDGTGASMYTDFMAALSRGVQGIGRNELPTAGDLRSELIHRTAAPAFRLFQIYGGLSAAGESDDQLAIWRSAFQEDSESPGRQGFRKHFNHTTAAYTACLYAHRTAAIVTDELVLGNALRKYKAVIVSFEIPLPPDMLTKLQEFQQAGGLVLAHQPVDDYWCPPGAIELGPIFHESRAAAHANLDSERHIGVEEDGINGAPHILRALGEKVVSLAECDDPTTWISVLKSGKAKYIYTVNLRRIPQPTNDLHRYSGYENTRMPAKSTLTLQPGDYAIYDVFAGKEVAIPRGSARWTITADMSVFPGAVFALLPARIDHLRVGTGQSPDKASLEVIAKVCDAKGAVIDAAVPLEITVADAAGTTRYHLYRAAKGGLWQEALPMAANDAAGRWTVAVTELFSGKTLTGSINFSSPALPAAVPTQAVEWSNAGRVRTALKSARHIAVIVSEKQALAVMPIAEAVMARLARQGKAFTVLTDKDYLDDRKALKWDTSRFGRLESTEIKLRQPKYDLIITFDTPTLPGGVTPFASLPIQPTADDPGPERGFVQYAVMPVYDGEDAIALFGGDVNGLRRAAEDLLSPEKTDIAATQKPVNITTLEGKASLEVPSGLRQFIGVPVHELAALPDGTRIVAGLKGWGNNLFTLDGDGKVISQELCGKFFPLSLQGLLAGFTVLTHENDPTTLYLKYFSRDGQPSMRLAAAGRRIGGARDWSASQPEVMPKTFLKQASFSVTPDGRFAAVGGSKAIAVWDLQAKTVLWRDDNIHYESHRPGNTAIAKTESFPQLKLSADGAWLALQHGGKLHLRNGKNGEAAGEIILPMGAVMGPVQLYDGHALVIGDQEFFGFHDGILQWRWKAPEIVTSCTFSADGLRYAVGQVDGVLRMMQGGGQAGGVTTSAAITTVALLPDAGRVAFASSAGEVGVCEFTGKVIWRRFVGARANVQFLGTDGSTVVGDWRGIVRRFDPVGQERWQVDLTPLVYREDAAKLLTMPDAVPTLRLPPPDGREYLPQQGTRNVASEATVTYLPVRSWWNRQVKPERPAVLNDGKMEVAKEGWFDRTNLEYAAFVPSPPAWEFTWKEPMTIDCLRAFESPDHPEAVPEEIKIEAWINDGWQEIVHTFWNSDVEHVHRFAPVTTTKLRYMPMGDLANNVYLSEIEIYAK